jgi:hypothetical protein
MPGQQSQGSARQAKADKEAELRSRRLGQLKTVQAVAEALQNAVRSAHDKGEQCGTLSDHLSGLYEEVDKLAKGKALLEATDLTVEHVNNVVRDAKALIAGDTYLDRVKEFVPAGNNPLYPDVLLTVRAVQQAVSRFQTQLDRRKQNLARSSQEARTIICALQFFVDYDGNVATKEQVATMIDHPVETWFRGDYGIKAFDFPRLDNRDIGAYLSASLESSDAQK